MKDMLLRFRDVQREGFELMATTMQSNACSFCYVHQYPSLGTIPTVINSSKLHPGTVCTSLTRSCKGPSLNGYYISMFNVTSVENY